MTLPLLALVPLAFVIALCLCALVRHFGRKLGTLDTAPLAGQVKAATRSVPNTGGVGVFWAIVLPVAAVLLWAHLGGDALPEWVPGWASGLGEHAAGVRARTGRALVFLGALASLHVLGLIDDRKPLGPVPKLGVMLLAALAVAWPVNAATDTRLFTLLDGYAGGAWLSVMITVAWFVVITNAMNFLDNMDGLSGGVAAVCSACMLAAALVTGQWFVAGLAALTLGACCGFLVFNVAPASLFMGDSGSLVLGFTLATAAARTTYTDADSGHMHGVFVPLAVLAVPLYDIVTVSALRISQGRSPMVGDLQHVSHRLVKRGLGPRSAVAVVWAFALVTGIAGVVMIGSTPWQATLLGAQVVLLLVVLASLEWRAGAHRRAMIESGRDG